MTKRLELNWKLDGVVDVQRYYCSETPIDPEDLPTAKAVLAKGVRTYTDTDINVGKTYYIRIGALKNSIERVSDEVSVVVIGEDIANVFESIYARVENVSIQVTLTGGVSVVSASVIDGALPDGWTMNSNGLITGYMTAEADTTYNFTLQVVGDDATTYTKSFIVDLRGASFVQLEFGASNYINNTSTYDGVSAWQIGSGNTTVLDDGEWVLSLNGSSSARTPESGIRPIRNYFSFRAKIKITEDRNGNFPIFYYGDHTSNINRDSIYVSDKKIRCYRQGVTGTGTWLDAPNILPVNEWVEIGYTIQGTVRKLFINGVLVAQDTYTSTLSGAPRYLYLGVSRSNGNPTYASGLRIKDVLVTSGSARFE